MFELNLETACDSAMNLYKVKKNGYSCGKIVTSGTGNCQISTFRYFYEALEHMTSAKDAKQLCEAYRKKSERPILLLDINEKYVERTVEFFGNAVIMKSPYTSSNKSEMCILLINTSNI